MDFLYNFRLKYFFILRKTEGKNSPKCTLVFMLSALYSCPILMKLKFSRKYFEKCSNFKFHENPSIRNRVVPCGQTDMTKLTVAFHNFAEAPKNGTNKVVKFQEIAT